MLPIKHPVRIHGGRNIYIAIKKIDDPSVNLKRSIQMLLEKKLMLLRDTKEHLKKEKLYLFLEKEDSTS